MENNERFTPPASQSEWRREVLGLRDEIEREIEAKHREAAALEKRNQIEAEKLEYLRRVTAGLDWIQATFGPQAAHDQASIHDLLNDLQREQADRFDKLELLILLKGRTGNGKQYEKVTGELEADLLDYHREMVKSEIDSVKVQIKNSQTRLNKLREQISMYGTEVPPSKLAAEEQLEKEIKKMNERWQMLSERYKALR